MKKKKAETIDFSIMFAQQFTLDGDDDEVKGCPRLLRTAIFHSMPFKYLIVIA
jgi:hypothetical protein